jgi:hypothetical protein
MHNAVSNPKHYLKRGISPQKVAEYWDLSANLMNTIKYIARFRDKGRPVEDLRKAVWYLMRELELETARSVGREPIDIDDKEDPHNPFGLGFLVEFDDYGSMQPPLEPADKRP